MRKHKDIRDLNIKELKTLWTHKDTWEIDKENEYPLICLVFLYIQDKLSIDITFEVFIKKYKFVEYNKEQLFNRIEFYLKILTREFENLNDESLKYQEECLENNINNESLKYIKDLTVFSYEKILNMINCDTFINKIKFFEELFYLLAEELSKSELNEFDICNCVKASSYYYDYSNRFIEYPLSLNKIKKIELFEFDMEYIPQLLILSHKCKQKSNFRVDLQKFYYINVLLKPEIFTSKYEDRKRDLKNLQWAKKPYNMYHHPQLLADIMEKVNKPLFKSLKSGNYKSFLDARIRDLKDNNFSRINVLFVFFLINFSFETFYNIKHWFYKTVTINFDESVSYFDNDLPSIKEFGVNKWGIVYTKTNKNTLIYEDPVMYFRHKKNSFEMILTKYFEILRDINPVSIRWLIKEKFEMVDISDFLKYNLSDYTEILVEDKEDEIMEDINEEVEEEPIDDYFIDTFNKAKKNYTT